MDASHCRRSRLLLLLLPSSFAAEHNFFSSYFSLNTAGCRRRGFHAAAVRGSHGSWPVSAAVLAVCTAFHAGRCQLTWGRVYDSPGRLQRPACIDVSGDLSSACIGLPRSLCVVSRCLIFAPRRGRLPLLLQPDHASLACACACPLFLHTHTHNSVSQLASQAPMQIGEGGRVAMPRYADLVLCFAYFPILALYLFLFSEVGFGATVFKTITQAHEFSIFPAAIGVCVCTCTCVCRAYLG